MISLTLPVQYKGRRSCPFRPSATRPLQAAAAWARSVDLSRAGLPPGGVRGKWSRLESASRMSSIETGVLPGRARRAGFEFTAAASEAHEARWPVFRLARAIYRPEHPLDDRIQNRDVKWRSGRKPF